MQKCIILNVAFQKEDVELALRSREMNREEALELLSQLRSVDQWRRHDTTHSGYDPTHQATTAPAYPRFNHVAQQMSFPPVSLINIYICKIYTMVVLLKRIF